MEHKLQTIVNALLNAAVESGEPYTSQEEELFNSEQGALNLPILAKHLELQGWTPPEDPKAPSTVEEIANDLNMDPEDVRRTLNSEYMDKSSPCTSIYMHMSKEGKAWLYHRFEKQL